MLLLGDRGLVAAEDGDCLSLLKTVAVLLIAQAAMVSIRDAVHMGDGDDASIEIDLGTATDVSGFGMRSRVMSDGTAIIETYTVTVDDGEVLGPFPAGQAFSQSPANASGQRFRFDADTTTGGNTGAAEV